MVTRWLALLYLASCSALTATDDVPSGADAGGSRSDAGSSLRDAGATPIDDAGPPITRPDAGGPDPMPGAGVIACGDEECGLPDEQCCASADARCRDATDDCGCSGDRCATALHCDGREDCPGTQLCCLVSSLALGNSSECRAACRDTTISMQVELCHLDAPSCVRGECVAERGLVDGIGACRAR
jgi:hypothetical protein